MGLRAVKQRVPTNKNTDGCMLLVGYLFAPWLKAERKLALA